VERSAAPELLPILRSQQQGELLTAVLEEPEQEASLADLGRRLGIPDPSVHREIERAERSGIVTSRKVGRTRLIRANTASPYFRPLRELLVLAFGPPARLRDAVAIDGVDAAYIFGSWAAAWAGEQLSRPIGDIDLLVLGEPDREELYPAVDRAGQDLNRHVQVQIRPAGWLENGDGSFHETVVGRPMLRVYPDDAAT